VTTREESGGMTLVVRRWSRCLSSVRRIAIAGALALPCSAQHVLERISATPAGLPASGWSSDAWITPCGRWIAFDSDATDLIPFDPGINDVFVRDRMFATTARVSVNTAGQRANDDCESPSLSEDGRIVVFASAATNLATPAPAGPWRLIYVRDLALGTTEIASAGLGGAIPDAPVLEGRVSGNGRFVVFETAATNVVAADSNGVTDVFVRDLATGSTVRANVAEDGSETTFGCDHATISADGRLVAYQSDDPGIVANDTNSSRDVFLHDFATNLTIRASVGLGGGEALFGASSPWITPDGRKLVFESFGDVFDALDNNGFVQDVFVMDLATGASQLVSVDSSGTIGNANSYRPRPSRDGRIVAFESVATNFGPGTPDPNVVHLYLRDIAQLTTTRLSIGPGGVDGDDFAERASVTGDGRGIAFESRATTLFAPPDSAPFSDVILAQAPVPAQAASYCTAKTSSILCVPQVVAHGYASAGDAWPFHVGARELISHRSGLGLYGSGSASTPFHGGFLCVQPPFRRLPLQLTGGASAATDCTGRLSYDFNAEIRSGASPWLVAGASAFVQFWFRDPPSLQGSGLSDALSFTVQN
jgi:Tol biopolymer transport system component